MTRRFYVPDLSRGKVIIGDAEAHHAINVVRVKVGDNVELFDGKGNYAKGSITAVTKSKIELIADEIETSVKPISNITLAFAVPKFPKQEALILMCTEIGISEFIPVVFARSSVRENARIEKWIRWSIQACKQSGRNYLPLISQPVNFNSLVDTFGKYGCIIYGKHHSNNNAVPKLSNKQNILILVGPEGGFTEQENQTIQSQNNAYAMQIGQHTLRIETAAVALSSVVSYLIGSDG